MKAVMLGLFLALLWSLAPVKARIAVAPMIIEPEQVQAGQVLAVHCQNRSEEPVEVELALVLFDQDARGKVVLLEDGESVTLVERFLSVEPRYFVLPPGASQEIQVQVLENAFQHLYAALLIKPRQNGLHSRLAVLLLLSGAEEEPALGLSSWRRRDAGVSLRVENRGGRHGSWAGELLLYDGQGRLASTMRVHSGLVLPGRSRGVQVSLPGWVEQVEVRSLAPGGER